MRALDELERRFAEAIEADQAAARGGVRGRLRRLLRGGGGGGGGRPRLPLGVTVAAVTLAVVVLAAAGLLLSSGGGEPLTPAQQLERIARTAEDGPPAPVLRGAQAWYTRQESMALGTFRLGTTAPVVVGVRRVTVSERWANGGPRGRTRQLVRRLSIPDAADRARWRAHGSPSLAQLGDSDVIATAVVPPSDRGRVADTSYRWDELGAVPTDPRALLREVADDHVAQQRRARRRPSEREVRLAQLRTIRALLLAPVPPKQRAALVRALALMPGADVVGRGEDLRGRPGLVVSIRGDGVPEQLIVGDDGRLLGYRQGSDSTAYLVAAVAPSVEALPAGVDPPPGRLPRTERLDPGLGR